MKLADRNLLFGILAVQLNFVGRDDLIAAMHAWVPERSKPLGRIPVDQRAHSPARHDLLEQLVDEHLAAHGGAAEKSLTATDGIGAIRDELERVADPEIRATPDRVPAAATSTRHDPDATLTYSQRPPVFDPRFSILRPHARLRPLACRLPRAPGPHDLRRVQPRRPAHRLGGLGPDGQGLGHRSSGVRCHAPARD
jgi:hypothetical protein